MPEYDLSKILPHNSPMILLDDIIDYDLNKNILIASFKIHPEKIFFDKEINGINSLVGIEFMAQTIGCYSYFKDGCKPPKMGLLLGTRLFNNSLQKFENGLEYYSVVNMSFSDGEIYAFDCKITDIENEELQSACIKVYKGENIEEFLKNGIEK